MNTEFWINFQDLLKILKCCVAVVIFVDSQTIDQKVMPKVRKDFAKLQIFTKKAIIKLQ